ncbi:MAG: YceI family protein [Ginsengibacter sp.]
MMIKRITSALVLIAASFTMQAQGTYKMDPAHSKLGFTITHLGIADVPGHFDKFDVVVKTTKKDFSDAVVEMNADVNTINTRIAPRDKHLRSADFFDVEKYPSMTFKSNAIRKIAENKYELSGELTMRGITKPVKINMWHRGSIQKKEGEKLTAGLQFTATIKRSDFNLGSKFPAPMLSDEVTLKGDGEFLQQ